MHDYRISPSTTPSITFTNGLIKSARDERTCAIDLPLPIVTVAPFIRQSTSWLIIIIARASGGRGGAELISHVAVAIIVGGPDKSTNGGMLTNNDYPDGPAFSMGI